MVVGGYLSTIYICDVWLKYTYYVVPTACMCMVGTLQNRGHASDFSWHHDILGEVSVAGSMHLISVASSQTTGQGRCNGKHFSVPSRAVHTCCESLHNTGQLSVDGTQ